MEWAGWSGQSDITESFLRLVQGAHYMAATIILAAFVEYQLSGLLWAILVDSGLSKRKATAIANGSLPRGDTVRMIRDLLERKVANLVFPMRNEVAHGRAFGIPDDSFVTALEDQLIGIEEWVRSVSGGSTPSGYDYTELDRWILSMQHWAAWTLARWDEHREKKSQVQRSNETA
jgi:hypothetical protein